MADELLTLAARVAAAQALAAAATPGPWDWIGSTPVALYSVPLALTKHAILAPHGACISRMDGAGRYLPLGAQSGDARLIAAAPDLVALVTDLWAEVEMNSVAISGYIGEAVHRSMELDESRKRTAGERDEARAEVARLRALLTQDGIAWGEHIASLGDKP